MSEVQALLRHYAEVRNRLRRPPNAVPDTGINLRRDNSPPPEPEPLELPERNIELTPLQKRRVETYRTSFCRKDITFRNILKFVAAEFGVEHRRVLERSRNAKVVLPRQISFYLADKYLQQSLSSMGKCMELDHTSVLHGRNKIKRLVASDGTFRDRIKAIEAKLVENYPGLAVPAINECPVEIEPGTGSQVGEIFPVDISGGTAFFDPEEGSHQDVGGSVHSPTTAIHKAP